jgi:hypothetical protein
MKTSSRSEKGKKKTSSRIETKKGAKHHLNEAEND